MQLKGSTFIVTGGASGLGEGTVKMLVEAGANAVIADLQADKGEALAKQLGAKARFVRCDVTSEADGQAAVDAALKTFAALQGLVNCAGIAIAERTVKAHFNRLFQRFGIKGGIKRVKLATMLYRRQLWSEKQSTPEDPAKENMPSSNLSPKAARTGKLRIPSALQNTLSRITSA